MTDISAATRERVRAAWPAICAAVASGELVRVALERAGVSRGEQYAYLVSEPGARVEWDAAREQSADSFADMALSEAMASYTPAESAHARTRIDTYKWAARIRNPRLYSDKQTLDVNVRTVDLTRIIHEANERLRLARSAGREPVLIEHATQAPVPDTAALALRHALESML